MSRASKAITLMLNHILLIHGQVAQLTALAILLVIQEQIISRCKTLILIKLFVLITTYSQRPCYKCSFLEGMMINV